MSDTPTPQAPGPLSTDACIDALAHLAGAVSAYRTYAKRAPSLGRVPPDPFYTTRLGDMERALERLREAFTTPGVAATQTPTDAELAAVAEDNELYQDYAEGRSSLEHLDPVLYGRAVLSRWGAVGAMPALHVVVRSYPESNGKKNWTALLCRVGRMRGLVGTSGGIVLDHGEYWNRVAYTAERARYLLGHRDTEPFILDYGNDIQDPSYWQGEKSRLARAATTKESNT